MDETSKPPDGPAVVAGLRQALDNAARCIELAKREAARVDASLRERSEGGAQMEQVFLDTTRKRREQLLASDLRFEVPPLPVPQELPAGAPLSLAETNDLSEIETLAPALLARV
ncbi:MAG TPA: hypothetical protein VGP73_27170 [Thermoanaerobaculia bacterium]